MAISMVREPSETPNISNTDDIVSIRYAYGNQNGYVLSMGEEISLETTADGVRIGSGRLVIDGVESDIDSNGVLLSVDNIAQKLYCSVVHSVNLGQNKSTIEIITSSASYPVVEKGDDLTQFSSGTAKMELYRFTATSGIISDVEKIVKPIEYTGTALVGYDISKGTIEDRFDKLGFKEGNIVISNNYNGLDITHNRVTRQGNYAILELDILVSLQRIGTVLYQSFDLGYLPNNFIPLQNPPNISVGNWTYGGGQVVGELSVLGGNVQLILTTQTGSTYPRLELKIRLGYEAKPIN